MFSRFAQWPTRIAAWLPACLPSACALCGRTGGRAVCDACHVHHFGPRHNMCSQCALPLPDDAGGRLPVCGACLAQPPAFDATIAAAAYAPPIDQLVLGLKFGHRLALAPLFAELLRDALLQETATSLPSLLTAVPLGPQRLAERGFNQALEIAKPLSRRLGIRLDAKLVVRTRETEAQTMLTPEQRHRNVRHAFIIPHEAAACLHGQHIGIVDDVMTTGATLDALASTLKRFGAARVTNFVFARTARK